MQLEMGLCDMSPLLLEREERMRTGSVVPLYSGLLYSTRAVPIYVVPPQFTANLAQAVCRESIELLHVEVRGAV